MSDAFYKSSFFLNYSTLLYDCDQLNSCWCIVSVLASHQYYFSVVKECVCNVYKPRIQKVRNITGKMLIATSYFKIQEN